MIRPSSSLPVATTTTTTATTGDSTRTLEEICNQVDLYLAANMEAARVNGGYVDRQRGLLILTLTWKRLVSDQQCAELSELFGVQVGAFRGGLVLREAL